MRIKKILLFFALCLLTSSSGFLEGSSTGSAGVTQDSQWEVKDVGTVALFERAHTLDLNDNGVSLLLCTAKDGNGKEEKYRGVGNVDSGFVMLPELMQSGSNAKVVWLKVNGDDTAIGILNVSVFDGYTPLGVNPVLVTWNKYFGVRQYPIDSSLVSTSHWVNRDGPTVHDRIVVARCGDSSDIVLSFDGKIYRLEGGRVQNITSKFNLEAKYHGVDCYQLNWKGLAVNGSGEIFGLLECFDKHPYKDTTVLRNKKFFHWDGKAIRFVDIPENTNLSSSLSSFYMNSTGKITFHWFNNGRRESFVWDVENDPLELKVLELNHGGNNYRFHILAVLNDGTVVWLSDDHQAWQAILFQDEDGLLPIYFNEKQKIESSNIESSNYPGVKLSYPGYYPVINNRKEIILMGRFFGEEHPFLLSPVFE